MTGASAAPHYRTTRACCCHRAGRAAAPRAAGVHALLRAHVRRCLSARTQAPKLAALVVTRLVLGASVTRTFAALRSAVRTAHRPPCAALRSSLCRLSFRSALAALWGWHSCSSQVCELGDAVCTTGAELLLPFERSCAVSLAVLHESNAAEHLCTRSDQLGTRRMGPCACECARHKAAALTPSLCA